MSGAISTSLQSATQFTSATLPHHDGVQSQKGLPEHFATKATDIQATAIRYNPKLDPKYDARASMGAAVYAQGDSVAFLPGTGMGKSLVGHELTHVVQQRKG